MEQFNTTPGPEEQSPLRVAFKAAEDLSVGASVMHHGTRYTIKDIYPDMKNGLETPMYQLVDEDGEPLQKDGIIVYVPAEELESE